MKSKLAFEELYKIVKDFRSDSSIELEFQESSLLKEFRLVEDAGWNWSEFNAQYLRFEFINIKVNSHKLPYDNVALEYDRLTNGALFREAMSDPLLDPIKIQKLISNLENETYNVAEYLGACGWEYVEFMDERNKRSGISFEILKDKFESFDAMISNVVKITDKTSN